MNATPAAEIAKAEKPYFPKIDENVLADCIATYQRLGCWTPHVEITQAAYEKTLDKEIVMPPLPAMAKFLPTE